MEGELHMQIISQNTNNPRYSHADRVNLGLKILENWPKNIGCRHHHEMEIIAAEVAGLMELHRTREANEVVWKAIERFNELCVDEFIASTQQKYDQLARYYPNHELVRQLKPSLEELQSAYRKGEFKRVCTLSRRIFAKCNDALFAHQQERDNERAQPENDRKKLKAEKAARNKRNRAARAEQNRATAKK